MDSLDFNDMTAQVLGFGIWIGLWPRACQYAYEIKFRYCGGTLTCIHANDQTDAGRRTIIR